MLRKYLLQYVRKLNEYKKNREAKGLEVKEVQILIQII